MPKRTYYYYYKRLESRIANEQKSKRREDILTEKEVCKARLTKALQGLQKIADDEKVTPRTRMDSLRYYAEVAVFDFKLEAESANWIQLQKSLNLPEAIPLSELTEEEWQEVANGRNQQGEPSPNASEDDVGEQLPPSE